MKAIKANNFVAINKDEVQFDLLLIIVLTTWINPLTWIVILSVS